eukprot:2159919-Prymnesium_polylepis.1
MSSQISPDLDIKTSPDLEIVPKRRPDLFSNSDLNKSGSRHQNKSCSRRNSKGVHVATSSHTKKVNLPKKETTRQKGNLTQIDRRAIAGVHGPQSSTVSKKGKLPKRQLLTKNGKFVPSGSLVCRDLKNTTTSKNGNFSPKGNNNTPVGATRIECLDPDLFSGPMSRSGLVFGTDV